jgi:DNA-binding IclR family transcriptional regulator
VKAQTIARHDPVREQLEPFLESLRDETGETVILGKRLGDKVVYLNIVEPEQSIRYTATVGDLKPMHSTSAGKALLGAMPAPEREKMIARMTLDRKTAATITQRSRLLEDIEEGMRRGWFASRGESVVDVMGVAAFLNLGGDTFTVTVAGPIHRMEPKVERQAKRLVATCKAITQSSPIAQVGRSKGHAA